MVRTVFNGDIVLRCSSDGLGGSMCSWVIY